jgi:FixJ family two-component response regulator
MLSSMARADAKTVAIVDDDDDVRTGLQRLLLAMGHRVVSFASAEAFEADAVTVDCAIVDMRLPGSSGLELTERLSRRPDPVPVVLVTGDAHGLAADRPAAAGIPLLSKPFDEAALLAAMASAMTALSLRDAD